MDTAALDAYFQRIAYTGPREPTVATLQALQLAHATHIPFENIDVYLGRPLSLTPPDLHEKLVTRRRGGYCFEQNTFFAEVLRALGFPVTLLLARVRFRSTSLHPRTHLVLQVEIDGQHWLADVGFGAEGLLQPLTFVADQPVTHFTATYQLVRDDYLWVLQAAKSDGWADLYAFSLEPQFPIDVEMANYYVATRPGGLFRTTLALQLPQPGTRTALRNRELAIETAAGPQTQPVTDPAALPALLTEYFGITLPAADYAALAQRLWEEPS